MKNRLLELEASIKSEPAAQSLRVRRPRRFSKPFLATGEHVLAGEDLPELDGHEKVIQPLMANLLLDVGRPGKTVKFTYGEIIAMGGDLFESFNEMDAASQDELTRIRTMVRRARDYDQKRIFGGSGTVSDPGNKDWQDVTGGRYLKLALDNYTHFAPSDPVLLTPAKSGDTRNHRDAWEEYHEVALKMVKANPTDQTLNRALAINAFGDHYLTDAFAAGHLFNKNDVAQRFNSLLVDAKGGLTAAGKTFFNKLASTAFTGDLKAAFSKHETVETYGPSVNVPLIGEVGWNPNIHTASRFEEFLKAVHNADTTLIGKSIVAKIIHDKLNNNPGGVAVANKLGDTWSLRGDGTMDRTHLLAMRKAVARSIYNVFAEATQVSNFNALYDYVWQYTPQPTAATKTLIQSLIKTYTAPDNPELIKEAAKLLQEIHPMLLKEAVERGKLQRA